MSRARTDADELRMEIEALIVRFAWRIDHERGWGVEELFTPDGVYAFGPVALEGRAAIAGFYEHRRGGGGRTSRHLFCNLHLRRVAAERAEGTCVLTLHAADGPPPHRLAPLLVADYDDVYVREADGVWRFERRFVTVLFGQVPQLGR